MICFAYTEHRVGTNYFFLFLDSKLYYFTRLNIILNHEQYGLLVAGGHPLLINMHTSRRPRKINARFNRTVKIVSDLKFEF